MNTLRIALTAAALGLAGCAGMNTRVVQLNPALQLSPSQSVEVLLQKPPRAYVEIALLESEGYSEVDLLNDAREKAKTLGADAILRQSLDRIYRQPVAVYDPWYDPFYFGYPSGRPYAYYASPWGPYRYVGGGYTYVLKATAIKYAQPPG